MMRLEKDLHEIGYSLKPHRHDCYLMLFITQGGGTHTIDGENFKITPPCIFFLTPGQIHSFEFTKNIAGYVVYFTMDFYLHYARERHFDKIPFFRSSQYKTIVNTTAESMKSIVVLLEEMLSEFTLSLAAKEDALRNFLDILLIRMNRIWDQREQRTPGKIITVVQIRKLMRLIETHYKKIKTPGEYARLMSLTTNHLNTVCKQTLKRTVTELIHDRIILEAKRLLAYTDWGVKKIANDIGYKDNSYFLRLFKKKTGMTPDQFRSNSNIVK